MAAISILLEEKIVYFSDLNKKAHRFAKEVLDNYAQLNYSSEKKQIVVIDEQKALAKREGKQILNSKTPGCYKFIIIL